MISGCIQISSSTQSGGYALGGAVITEHTYLFGDEGFLTKKYDLTIFILGQSKKYTDLSASQLQAIGQMYGGTGTQQNTIAQQTIVPLQTTTSQENIPITTSTIVEIPTPASCTQTDAFVEVMYPFSFTGYYEINGNQQSVQSTGNTVYPLTANAGDLVVVSIHKDYSTESPLHIALCFNGQPVEDTFTTDPMGSLYLRHQLPASSITPAPISTPTTPVSSQSGHLWVLNVDNAIIISIVIFGLVFGAFALYESKFWGRK
jgi:hypothetical protein